MAPAHLGPANLGPAHLRPAQVGVDTGGTFTDVVGESGELRKVPSTPDDPSEAVAAGLRALGNGGPELLAHGTTVATNALLERKGATVALITTTGLADVIEIGRQDRPSLYDIWADRPEPLVPRHLRFEVSGRMSADGREIAPLHPSDVPPLPPGVEAVAVCLLHSDLDDTHERIVSDELEGRGHVVRRSSEVSPEFREFERTVTTVIDAYLGPLCRRYMEALSPLAAHVLVMTSAGGLADLADVATKPASLLVSGPAAGVRAGAAAAASAGFADAVTFDMGGTSTDVCLVLEGSPEPAAQRVVAGLPVRMPALDVHTIGAGGGSIAALDSAGALRVGPVSARARPGPACYRLGGTDPTVTDADLAAGRIPSTLELPGIGQLDVRASRDALSRAGIDPLGVISVVDTSMVQAVRFVSVERGVDPRCLALVAFGGAGPLHACALADALEMPAVVVPPRAGVLSAVGLLCSPRQANLVMSWPSPGSIEGLEAALDDLARRTAGALPGSQVVTSLDCRYAGQSHELTVASVADFEDEHRKRNGYALDATPIEVVALRARATIPSPFEYEDLPAPPERGPATGPCSLAEPDCTVWVPEGWKADVAGDGSWVLTR